MNHQDQFKNKDEATTWLNTLSDDDYIFFANLNREIYSQNFGGTKNDLRFDNFKREKEREIASIKSQNDKELKSVAEEASKQADKIKSLKTQLETKEADLNEAIKKEKAIYDEDTTFLRRRIIQLETEQANLVKTQVKEKEDHLKKNFELKQEKALLKREQEKFGADKELESLKEDNYRKADKIEQFEYEKKTFFEEVNKNLKRSEKSVKLGKDGETFIQNLLSGDPFYPIENVSETNHKGDFAVRIRNSNYRGLLEVKNFNENVTIPKADRDKFVKDLDDNEEYNYALLASLNGGFPSTLEEYKIYSTPKGKLYCFVGCVATKEDPKFVLKMTWLSLDIATEKVGAQGSEKTDFINLLEGTVKHWQENIKIVTSLEKQANTTFKKSQELRENLAKGLKWLECEFDKLKHKQISNGGATAIDVGSPFKRPRVEQDNQNNS